MQEYYIQALFPSFKMYIGSGGFGYWEGYLKPTPMSANYKVKIDYSEKTNYVNVSVLGPHLISRAGEKIPHRYSNGSLCLFYPKDKEWHPKMHLAATIIPWTAEWLYYYEIWMISGNWNGAEVKHTNDK